MGGWLLVFHCAVQAVLAGPGFRRPFGHPLPYELPVGFEEPGDQLVIDGDTGGLDHVKVRPLAAEDGPFSWAVEPSTFTPSASSSSSSSWEPLPSATAQARPPAPAPVPEEPSAVVSARPPAPSPAPEADLSWLAREPPNFEELASTEGMPEMARNALRRSRPREGWPPLPLDCEHWWRGRVDNLETELARYPFRAVYHEEKAKKAAARSNDHYWHTSKGPVNGAGSRSPHAAPVSTPENLAWTFQHRDHRWCTIHGGVCIDDKLDIYLASFDAMRKFDLTGRLLWETYVQPSTCTQSPCLYKGGIYGILTTGEVFGMDIEDGTFIWLTKVSYCAAQDNGWVQAFADQVVVGADEPAHLDSGSLRIIGLSALDGTQLWQFRPDAPVWNFAAAFPNDGTLLFQDFTGQAYCLAMKDGAVKWKAGGKEGTWTDGTSVLGPDMVFYTVTVDALKDRMWAGCGGWVTAYRIKDGKQLWQARTQEPPNVAPAIGPLEPGGPLRVVQPTGAQCCPDLPTYIDVFDAKDGAHLWHFCGPKLQWREPFEHGYQAADPQGAKIREACGVRSLSLPNPWGAATLGGDGTIYCGNQDGQFYSLRQSDKQAINAFRYNGNWHGVVAAGKGKAAEVWAFDTYACYGGPCGAAIAPGVLVVPSIDTMYVFLDPSITSKPLDKKPPAQA